MWNVPSAAVVAPGSSVFDPVRSVTSTPRTGAWSGPSTWPATTASGRASPAKTDAGALHANVMKASLVRGLMVVSCTVRYAPGSDATAHAVRPHDRVQERGLGGGRS